MCRHELFCRNMPKWKYFVYSLFPSSLLSYLRNRKTFFFIWNTSDFFAFHFLVTMNFIFCSISMFLSFSSNRGRRASLLQWLNFQHKCFQHEKKQKHAKFIHQDTVLMTRVSLRLLKFLANIRIFCFRHLDRKTLISHANLSSLRLSIDEESASSSIGFVQVIKGCYQPTKREHNCKFTTI